MAYIFYATSPETAEKFGTSLLGLTIPFPIYGIFRYLYLVHQKEGGGSPSEMLLNDRPLLLCVALWGLTVAVIIYRPNQFGIRNAECGVKCGVGAAASSVTSVSLTPHSALRIRIVDCHVRFHRPCRLGRRRTDHAPDPGAHPRQARRGLHRRADPGARERQTRAVPRPERRPLRPASRNSGNASRRRRRTPSKTRHSSIPTSR